jgi:hypothetical protein
MGKVCKNITRKELKEIYKNDLKNLISQSKSVDEQCEYLHTYIKECKSNKLRRIIINDYRKLGCPVRKIKKYINKSKTKEDEPYTKPISFITEFFIILIIISLMVGVYIFFKKNNLNLMD